MGKGTEHKKDWKPTTRVATSTTTTRTTPMRPSPTELVASDRAFAQREPRRGTLHREPKTIRQMAGNNRATMAAVLFAPSAYTVANFNFIESVIGYDALLRSAYKCFKNVGHKFSTQSYSLDVIQKTVNLSNDLMSGRYKEGRTHIVNITYPKPRTALAISFRDRVTESGKVLMFRDPAQVKAIRRKYRRLANRIGRGEAEISDLDKSYQCVRSFMSKGNSRRLIQRMDNFVENLKKEVENA